MWGGGGGEGGKALGNPPLSGPAAATSGPGPVTLADTILKPGPSAIPYLE